jgi:hypothetical protein
MRSWPSYQGPSSVAPGHRQQHMLWCWRARPAPPGRPPVEARIVAIVHVSFSMLGCKGLPAKPLWGMLHGVLGAWHVVKLSRVVGMITNTVQCSQA